jgi:uroporphyrinogen decarboxylase
MQSGRERVVNALNFRPTDRIPKDLGGMRSTGISCYAYGALRKALGLEPRRPMVYDTGQMLAIPELDVLDALGCDVVFFEMDGTTNAFDRYEGWKPYGFDGRLDALVREPEAYSVLADGTIERRGGNGVSRMVPNSSVFDEPHGGNPLDLSADIPMKPIAELKRELASTLVTDGKVKSVAASLKRVRESSDRAVFFGGPMAGLGYPGGMAAWSMLCLSETDYVAEYHEALTEAAIENYARLLPEVAPYVDVIMTNSDDQGTQNATILPPPVFRSLYVPYYRRLNDSIHAKAPGVKSFLHCCGAVYDIIDDLVDSGFDVLNPVQWSAGGRSFREWKDRARGRLALWGGGVNTQTTLPFGTAAEAARETREVVSYLKRDSGYVFCAIHNLLANIAPEKILAIYRAADETE